MIRGALLCHAGTACVEPVGVRFGQWHKIRVSDKGADKSMLLIVHLLLALLQTFCQLYKLSAAIQQETRRTLMTFYFVGSQGPHSTSGSLSKKACSHLDQQDRNMH